jgi:TIR domain
LALQLRSDLAEKGYVVWLDVARLGGGSDWSREIESEIDAAYFVLTLSAQVPLSLMSAEASSYARYAGISV